MYDGNATSIIIALIGLMGLAVTALIWVGKYSLSRLGRDLQSHTKAALKQTSSNESVSKAVASFESYLRDRNGRDGEVHKEVLAGFKELPKTLETIATKVANNAAQSNLKAYKELLYNVPKQHVDQQIVDKAIVKERK